jgi:lipoyl(octanoyl) transferase
MGNKRDKWRLIIDEPRDAFMNMAIDEAIFTRTREDHYRPTLRFFQWEKPSLSYGYAVEVEKEVDVHYCLQNDIPIVRRITGGGVVFHQCDITFSIVFPQNLVPDTHSVLDSYKFINQIFVAGLKNFGINGKFYDLSENPPQNHGGENVCFIKPTQYDVVYEGKKLVGNAQRRKKGYILNHGSLLFSNDYEKMLKCLKVPDPGKMTEMATTIEALKGKSATRQAVIDALVEGFIKKLNIEFTRTGLIESEVEHAEQYCREKYSNYQWNFRF